MHTRDMADEPRHGLSERLAALEQRIEGFIALQDFRVRLLERVVYGLVGGILLAFLAVLIRMVWQNAP